MDKVQKLNSSDNNCHMPNVRFNAIQVRMLEKCFVDVFSMVVAFLRDISPYRPYVNRHFERAYPLHLQGQKSA
jgi:hypothetical protein